MGERVSNRRRCSTSSIERTWEGSIEIIDNLSSHTIKSQISSTNICISDATDHVLMGSIGKEEVGLTIWACCKYIHIGCKVIEPDILHTPITWTWSNNTCWVVHISYIPTIDCAQTNNCYIFSRHNFFCEICSVELHASSFGVSDCEVLEDHITDLFS